MPEHLGHENAAIRLLVILQDRDQTPADGNRGTVQILGETIPLELPLRSDVSSKDYIIYTGFALNREQLEYNRAQQ